MLRDDCTMHMNGNILMITLGKSFSRLENIIEYIGTSPRGLLKEIHSMQEYKGDLNIVWKTFPKKSIRMAISQVWEDLENEDSEKVNHYHLLRIEKMAFGKRLPTRQVATIFLAVAAHLFRRLAGTIVCLRVNSQIPSRFPALIFPRAEVGSSDQVRNHQNFQRLIA